MRPDWKGWGTRMPVSPSLSVLIFNDNAEVSDVLRALFEVRGHSVVTVQLSMSRGAYDVAWALAWRHKPEVVVYDVGSPYQSNWDFLEALRLAPPLVGIPFVLTTGNIAAVARLPGASAGVDLVCLPEELDVVVGAAEAAALVRKSRSRRSS